MILADILFPKFCVGCRKIGTYLCIKCRKKLMPINKDICIYCNKYSKHGLTHEFCKRKYGLDGIVCFFYYNLILKKVIGAIKYQLAVDVWKDFRKELSSDLLYRLDFFSKNKHKFFIQPIPLYKKSFKNRGFNQTEIIAEFLSNYLDIPIINNLIKVKETKSQASLRKGYERYRNIKDSFGVIGGNGTHGRNIILIDDVLTTGSTLKEASKTLKENNSILVYAITIARG